MQPKLIATDLDGTLLRSDKTISLFTRRVLNDLRAKGVFLVAATARPPRTVRSLDLPPLDGLICHNGAQIYWKGELLARRGLPHGALQAALSALLSAHPDAPVAVEMDDTLYANFNASSVWPESSYTYTDLSSLPALNADKLLLVLDAGGRALETLRYSLPRDAYLHISENRVAMVMHEDAAKEKAIRLLCEQTNISMDQVIAFGDDQNDVEMLRQCGLGVAMANAIPEAKAAADALCPSCDEDGAARFLQALSRIS